MLLQASCIFSAPSCLYLTKTIIFDLDQMGPLEGFCVGLLEARTLCELNQVPQPLSGLLRTVPAACCAVPMIERRTTMLVQFRDERLDNLHAVIHREGRDCSNISCQSHVRFGERLQIQVLHSPSGLKR